MQSHSLSNGDSCFAVLCVDAKLNFDDNAFFRQKDLFNQEGMHAYLSRAVAQSLPLLCSALFGIDIKINATFQECVALNVRGCGLREMVICRYVDKR